MKRSGAVVIAGAILVCAVLGSLAQGADPNTIVATPVFSVPGGTYHQEQTVTITCATPGAVIHYTMGTDPNFVYEPTENDPVFVSGSSIVVDHSMTLKARAWKDGLLPSEVKTASYTLVVEMPVLSTAGGHYDTEQTVTITCATPGATIHYTTNGINPTESDPVITSGSSIAVDRTLTLKARAWKDGFNPSVIKTANYWLQVTKPVFSKGSGYYSTEQTVTITCATPGATINYTTNGFEPTKSDPVIASGDSILVDRSMILKARAWKGAMTSSTATYAVFSLFVATPTFSVYGGTYNAEQTVAVSCATAGATIHYTTNGVDPTESDPVIASGSSIFVDHNMTLKARAWKVGFDSSAIPTATYTLVVSTPTFSRDGGICNDEQTVTISCDTPGAMIRYTLDGSDPDNGAIYDPNTPVHVDHTLTLKAKAWKGVMTPSAVKSATYTLVAATPVFSKAGGTYHDELMVEMTCVTPGAMIRYTLDGSDPNDGVIYDPATPVYVDHTLTLKAKAWKEDFAPSGEVSETYTLVVATPAFTPDGRGYGENQTVAVTCATAGATIYYTTDGSDPTVDSLVIENGGTIPVTIDPATVLKAIAYKGNLQPSSIKQAMYHLAGIFYVNAAATGANTGASWADASTDMQSALDAALAGDEIWVAAGTYKPTQEVGGTGNRYRSFQLKSGVGVYGGFNGTETGLDQRDWELNPTILSGDLAGNDNNKIAYNEPTRQDNCYHVLFHNDPSLLLDHTAVLDGFIISGGTAYGADDAAYGGGIYNYSASPTISNCIFRNNVAHNGGGMYNNSSSPTITGCVFKHNAARQECEIIQDWWYYLCEMRSTICGGGIYNFNASCPIIVDCSFYGNRIINYNEGYGGGICNEGGSNAMILNSLFAGNTFLEDIPSGEYKWIDSDNAGYGGGICDRDSHSIIIGCTMTHNMPIDDPYATEYGYDIATFDGTTTITNSIVRSGVIEAVNTSPVVTYSNVINNSGLGNINADPKFARVPSAGQDGVWCTDDDDYGDLHLQADSPCLDAGINAAVPADITTDLDGLPRIADDDGDGMAIVNMGAYESPRVATPTFNITSGEYITEQTVVVICTTPGAVIHYTTDGADPTESDPVIASGDSILVDHTLTLKARAFLQTIQSSRINKSKYVIRVSTPVLSVAGGTYNTEQMVVFTCATPGAVMHYTISTDPSYVYEPTENDPVIASGDSIYVDRSMTLKVKAWRTPYDSSAVKTATYALIVAVPVFTPEGVRYESDQTVQITCATPGTAIYYTTDGSDPAQGVLYEPGTMIHASIKPATTLKAIAFKGYLQPSSIKTAVYGGPIFVNAAATGANTGETWTDAFTDLQSGLDEAENYSIVVVWVAAGTYKPTKETGGSGSRYRTFQLKNGMGLYGGFNGTETSRDQRDWEVNPTILSGDLNNNGQPDPNDAYHVFYHTEDMKLNATAVLDGFIVTGGNTGNASPHDNGGGMYNYSASPKIVNCIFSGNAGTGVYNYYFSNPTVTNCIFRDNLRGQALYNYRSSPEITDCAFINNLNGGIWNYYYAQSKVTNCIFIGNIATLGGGIYNYDSDLTIKNCTFINNSASSGGGLYNGRGNVDVLNSVFIGNSASADGGGIYNRIISRNIINCTFVGNSASNGGGIYNRDAYPQILNCTISNNLSSIGGGIYNYYCRPRITNSIIWENTGGGNNSQIYHTDKYTPLITYSNIQGGWAGEGNIDADPLFVDAASGDLRLQAGSLCIDAGSNGAIPAEIVADIDGTPRMIDANCDGNAVVDMGAYEYFLVGDLNFTCGVDMTDFDILAAHWQQDDCTSPANCWQADIDRNGVVELEDFIQFAEQWLQSENIVPPPPPLPSPIAWWTMDETEGAVVSDSIGGYHGQMVNITGNPWVAGYSGNALKLDGVDDYVEMAGFAGISGTTSRTCSAWIKVNPSSASETILSWGLADSGQKWMFRVQPTGEISVGVWDGPIQGTRNLHDGQWHHVAAVLVDDGSPSINEVKLYVDGFAEVGNTTSTQLINTAVDQNVQIGSFVNTGVQYSFFNGLLDDVRIYNAALSMNQIVQLAME